MTGTDGHLTREQAGRLVDIFADIDDLRVDPRTTSESPQLLGALDRLDAAVQETAAASGLDVPTIKEAVWDAFHDLGARPWVDQPARCAAWNDRATSLAIAKLT